MRFLRPCALVLVLLGAPALANAQDTAELPRGNISGFGSFATATGDGLEGGVGFGFSGAYFFTDMVGVEGGFRRQSFDLEGNSTNLLLGGDLNTNVITANVVARFGSGKAQPYVTGGVAFYSNGYTTDAAAGQDLAAFNFTVDESIENTVGFNVGGGVDFQASRRIGIFVEGRFFAASADTSGGLIDDITEITAATVGTQDLNSFTISGGIRIYF